MAPLITLDARALPFPHDDVDTDQIIPARFLTGTTKTGLGQKMFTDWRYDANGAVRGDSLFDNPPYAGAGILVGGNNFGCGSSREHAPWALLDYGFHAILAVSFADIFYNNALKNFLLPAALPEKAIRTIQAAVTADPSLQLHVDLPNQLVSLPGHLPWAFEISAYRKKCLLEGLDDMAYVLSHENKIAAFEAARQGRPEYQRL